MIFYEPGHHKDRGFRHDPFKAVVSPRPIGWISTVDAEGRTKDACGHNRYVSVRRGLMV